MNFESLPIFGSLTATLVRVAGSGADFQAWARRHGLSWC
jgi:hypothetical protein